MYSSLNLKVRCPSIINPIKLILEFYYMANGLTFWNDKYNFANFFTAVRILIENGKIMRSWLMIFNLTVSIVGPRA